MHQELSSSAKISISMIILCMIISIVLLLSQIAMNLSKEAIVSVANTMSSSPDNMIALSDYNKPVPAPMVYTALTKAEGDIKDLELVLGGVTYTDIEVLKDFFGKKLFVDAQESNGYYKVRVRDS